MVNYFYNIYAFIFLQYYFVGIVECMKEQENVVFIGQGRSV